MRILGGIFKGRDLPTLTGDGCRPAMAKVREALFNMLAARGLDLEGARVLDVFAGTGSLGFEALSRGASYVQFVEANKTLARRIADNARLLGLTPVRFSAAPSDALKLFARPPAKPFRLAFVDPPYGRDLFLPVLDKLARNGFMEPGGFIAAEVEHKLDIPTWPAPLELEADRLYGQTRILIWTLPNPAPPSTPEPSTP